MKLFSFLHGLINTGSIAVDGRLSAFESDDLADSEELLKQFYEDDKLEMPATAPAYAPAAAIWAAKHLYLSLQMIVLRDISVEEIELQLEPFPGEKTPSAIYSADLVLRFLPSVFHLAKNLAPSDIMVNKMTQTGILWPFSSVSIDLQQDVDDETILGDPSLRTTYIDRIIKSKDLKRIRSIKQKESLKEVVGDYAKILAPAFYESIINDEYER